VTDERLDQQLGFALELDRLKAVNRRSWLVAVDRVENSAEHSWHVAMVASVVCEHADEDVDSTRVLRMLLIHDVVEIDAGDVFLYDTEARKAKSEAERRAAERIYGLLPGDQGRELHALWLEFEAGESADARFARAIDRLMPLLHNFHTEGRTWREHGITADQVLAANAHIELGSARLWKRAKALIEEAVERGYLAPPV